MGHPPRAERSVEPALRHPPSDPASPLPSIPDHELLRCIGRGAYGAVWLARNVMGTFRAVKIVHREDFARDRPFTREYEGLLKYEPISRSHPNLMQILHVGRRDEYFYYVTELADDAVVSKKAEGRRQNEQSLSPSAPHSSFCLLPSALASYVPRTLQEDLERRGRLPVRECVSLAVALTSALEHLHGHGLVHRDVKPSNIIFVHGVPKLADIGLVATVGDSRSIVGTEGYLPPEGPGNPQADLYSLGKLLYEVSTGLNRQDYPRLPRNLREWPDAPELLEFNEVLLRACAKDTDRRYHHAEELLADLALLERGASVKRLRRLERHHAVLRRVGVGLLAAGLVISAAWWQSWRAHRIARRHLAQLHVNEGTQRMVQTNYAAALPWLVGALELDAGNPIRERAHRVRIASVLERCPLPVAYFSVPGSRVLGADLNQDGTRLATAHQDGGLRVWNTRSGEQIQQVAHDFPVVFCQFLSSGDRILTVTVGQKTHVWDLASPGRDPLTFDQAIGFDSVGYSVGLSETQGEPDRAYLAKGRYRLPQADDFTGPFENLTLELKLVGRGDTLAVRYAIRRTATDREVLYGGEFRDSPNAEPFNSGRDDPPGPLWGRAFVMLDNGSVGDRPGEGSRVVWDNLKVRRYPSGEPPPRWRVVDDFADGALTNWVNGAPPDSGSTCRAVNGELVVSYENLPLERLGWPCVGWLELFDVSRGYTLELEVDLVSARAPHRQVALSLYRPILTPFTAPDRPFILHGRWLVSNWWDGTVRIWDLENGRFAAVQDRGRTVPLELHSEVDEVNLDVSPDAKHLACVAPTNRCSVWDLGSGHEVALEGLAQLKATGVRFSSDNRFLAVRHTHGLELIRTADWRPERTLGTGEAFGQPQFSLRGQRLAAVRDTREVIVWDVGNLGEPPTTFPHDFDVQRIALSPDGRYVASSSADRMVRVWDVIRGERFGPPLPGALGGFSADGSQLLLFGVEGGVWLWDLSHIVDGTLAVPPQRAEQLSAHSADGSMTAEIDGQGIMLRTPTGQSSLTAPVQLPLRRVAFSPDDQHVIAESLDLRAWVWDVRTRTLIGPPRPARYDATLESHSLSNLTAQSGGQQTLSELAALLGGQRPDGEGGMTPVDDANRARLLGVLQRARPAEFRPDDVKRACWHGEQANAAEQAMVWDAAVFHWEQALSLKSAIHNPQSAIAPESRLAYARQAAEVLRQAMVEGRSRWSVILPRQPWATPEMLDLDGFYTLRLGEKPMTNPPSASFRELASGVQVLGGTGFDVRGIIQLNETNPVTIPIGRACQRLHFLHAASQAAVGIRGPAGRYQVTYASGKKDDVQLQNPDDVPPYSAHGFHAVSTTARAGRSPGLRCALAWSGCLPIAGGRKEPLFLTRTTWGLPTNRWSEVIETLDLRALSKSGLLVFAITVE